MKICGIVGGVQLPDSRPAHLKNPPIAGVAPFGLALLVGDMNEETADTTGDCA